MLKTSTVKNAMGKGAKSFDIDYKERVTTRPGFKRAHSTSPVFVRPRSTVDRKKAVERRCQSLSPSNCPSKKINMSEPASTPSNNSSVVAVNPQTQIPDSQKIDVSTRDPVLPQCVLTKMMRIIATKKREFIKMCKCLVSQQNTLLENFAALREMESRAGVKFEDSVGEVRVLSVSGWPAHDLLMLVRDDIVVPLNSEIGGIFGPQCLQQLQAQLNPVPEDVLKMGAEIMARRIDILNLLRGKYRRTIASRSSFQTTIHTDWKIKNSEFEAETEKLHRMVAGTAENLKAKINYSLELAKMPWLDREALIKKVERLQKEIMILQHKIEDTVKKDAEDCDGPGKGQDSPNYMALCQELSKERSAREALKDVVSAAESMLRVARARIATLERQLKDTKTELEACRKKHKDLEQLYRHRETSYDARSKKLIEVSKTGEVAIEGLALQRDALELRVKELREQAEAAEKAALARETAQRSRTELLQAKVAEQEKDKKYSDARVIESEEKVKRLEDQLQTLRENSIRLVDMERRRCLEYLPSKENDPSDRETEIWKELQLTKVSLSRAEEELGHSRADKERFLVSLSRLAQGEDAESFREKMATELLDREQKIMTLQHAIEDQRENEKHMEQSMTQYENQLAAYRLEVKRLRNYDCYKELPNQDLQTEVLDLHMQVETLSRERDALVTAAASRALMLERHERSADLFAKMTLARKELASLLDADGKTDPMPMDDDCHAHVSRSLSSMMGSAANTWTALRVERARVISLETAVLAQSLQLDREGRVRTQLERRRALLERELLRASIMSKNPSLV